MSAGPEQRAVIHDLGYRPYTGERHGRGYIAWSLYTLGTRHCFGLGRSGRSKVLPMGLLGVMLLPSVILVGVVVVVGLDQQVVPYSSYPVVTQLLISVFVAAQAPVLFSRDIRYRTLSLYFARPLPRSTFVLVRYASLATALLVLVAAPQLVLYVGGLLADLPPGRETGDVLVALLGTLLLALLLAAFAGVVAAITPRRGLAVAAIVVALVVSYTVVQAVQGISLNFGSDGIAVAAGVLSPYTLVDGLLVWGFDAEMAMQVAPSSAVAGLAYLAAGAAVVGGGVLVLMARYRRLAGG